MGKDTNLIVCNPLDDLLHQEEVSIADIFENEIIPIAYLDRDFNYLLVNKAYASATGRSTEYFQGISHFYLYPNDELETLFLNVVETGRAYFADASSLHFLYSGNNQHSYTDWCLTPVKDKENIVTGVILLLLDVADKNVMSSLHVKHEEGQALLKSIIANAPIILFSIDNQGIFTLSDGKGLQALGLKPGEIIGQSVFDLYATEPSIIAAVKRALKGEVFSVRTEVNELIYEAYYSPLLDSQGTPKGTIGVAIDITERERAIEKVRHSERELSTILKNMQDTYYRTDNEGKLLLISDSVKQVFGYSPQELIGTNLANYYVDPQGREKFLHALQEAGGQVQNYESQLKCKNGEEIWLSTNSSYVIDGEGKIQGIEGTTRDITKRRQEQLMLARRKAEFESIFNSNTDAIVYEDCEHRISKINPAVSSIFGYSREELIGKTAEFLYAHSKDYQAFIGDQAKLELHTEKPIYEVVYRCRDGREFTGETLRTQVKDSNGRILGYMRVIRDVTVSKKEQVELSLLKSTLDRTLDCVFMFEPESLKFFYVNSGAMNQVGYSAQELHMMTPYDLKPDFDEAHFRKLIQPLIDGTENSLTIESRHQHKDGRIMNVEIFLQYIAPQSEPARFVAFVHDISKRKKSESQMRKLSAALEQTADAVFITDRDGIIEFVNPAFERVTGYSKDECLGYNPRILKSGQLSRSFYKRLWETIISGGVYRDVIINRKKDGTLFYEEKTITPLKDANGDVDHFISTSKDITERMHNQQRLQFLAHHDILTGLPNRVLFIDRLEHALETMRDSDELLAVVFLDLDRFKVINDTLGHDAGDITLQTIANRLQACVRRADTIARLGGDEFAVTLEGIKSIDNVIPVISKIIEDFSRPFLLDEHELFVTTSAGISLAPMDGTDAQTLLKYADIAMYRAKDLGRNNYQFYSSEMSARAFEKLSLETDLRYALERDEFKLYYQTQVDNKTGRVFGVEALLRWQHPKLGLVSPAEFIPILEETGIIVSVGEWVIRTACTDAKKWHKELGIPLRMSVNLSARQFIDPGLVNNLKEIIDGTGLDPQLLEVEITESVLMQDNKWTMRAFKKLSDMNIRFAIDDFGTGYSSLSYLKRFPIDTIKIDRSFIHDIDNDPDDEVIVQTIIAMAKSMNLQVIAEGVENHTQLNFLECLDCSLVQGFLISKPVPADVLQNDLMTDKNT